MNVNLEEHADTNDDRENGSNQDDEEISIYYESDYADETIDLDNDVIHQLKQNDPYIKKLDVAINVEGSIFHRDLDAKDVDWEEEGSCISKNSQLKSLKVSQWSEFEADEGDEDAIEDEIANTKAFYRAVSQNTSIECLWIGGEYIDCEDMSAMVACKSLRKITLDIQRRDGDDDCVSVLTSLNNQRLRELRLYLNTDNNNERWFTELGNLLESPTTKLVNLELKGLLDIDREEAKALGNALWKGSKILKKLSLEGVENIPYGSWSIILQGLSSNSLQELDLGGNHFGYDTSTLAGIGYKSLKSLSLHYAVISPSGWKAVLTSVLNLGVLETLGLFGSNVDEGGLKVVGNALKDNSTLKELEFGSVLNSTTSGWIALFGSLSQNCSLEKLRACFNDIGIDDECLAVLASSIGSTTLKHLDFSRNRLISSVGWQNFFSTIQSEDITLETLVLEENSIDDLGLSLLVDANIDSLSRLSLDGNGNITSTGLTALSALLQRPNSCLSELHLYPSNTNMHPLNDEVMTSFANALVGNNTMKKLCFWGGGTTTSRGWSALKNVLCNTSSVEGIYTSNHTLEEPRSKELGSLLDLNWNDNKREVARQKILQFHFTNGDNIQEFVDMKLNVIPHAVAWMARGGIGETWYGSHDTGHSLLYQLVKSMPSLFEFDSRAKGAAAAGKKRKL